MRLSKEQARSLLGLPLDRKMAIYTGKIFWGYQEMEYLIQAAQLIPDVHFLLVGGRSDHIERLQHRQKQEGPANLQFVGFVPPSQVQTYQMAADVLLSYYSSGTELNRYRSPGKLFEYMASGRPIITGDYPVMREVLDKNMVIFVPPDSPQLLAKEIQTLLQDRRPRLPYGCIIPAARGRFYLGSSRPKHYGVCREIGRVMAKLVNTAHPRQDIDTSRLARPGMFRYKLAAELVSVPTEGKVRCLELGGGAAEFSRKLKKMGYLVTFTDLNPNSVKQARVLGFESLQIDFNEGLPGLPDASFDLAVMLEVIEHIVNAEHLLAEIHRVLKPGAVLVLSTPNFAWWRERLGILFGQPPLEEGYHFRFFTVKSMTSQLKNAGFPVERWCSLHRYLE